MKKELLFLILLLLPFVTAEECTNKFELSSLNLESDNSTILVLKAGISEEQARTIFYAHAGWDESNSDLTTLAEQSAKTFELNEGEQITLTPENFPILTYATTTKLVFDTSIVGKKLILTPTIYPKTGGKRTLAPKEGTTGKIKTDDFDIFEDIELELTFEDFPEKEETESTGIRAEWQLPIIESTVRRQAELKEGEANIDYREDATFTINGNIKLPGSFRVYSKSEDELVTSKRIETIETNCTTTTNCSGKLDLSQLPQAHYYIRYEWTTQGQEHFTNAYYFKIGNFQDLTGRISTSGSGKIKVKIRSTTGETAPTFPRIEKTNRFIAEAASLGRKIIFIGEHPTVKTIKQLCGICPDTSGGASYSSLQLEELIKKPSITNTLCPLSEGGNTLTFLTETLPKKQEVKEEEIEEKEIEKILTCKNKTCQSISEEANTDSPPRQACKDKKEQEDCCTPAYSGACQFVKNNGEEQLTVKRTWKGFGCGWKITQSIHCFPYNNETCTYNTNLEEQTKTIKEGTFKGIKHFITCNPEKVKALTHNETQQQ
ncbi:MAG: hypothetical protein WC595_06335 [Candidatus Nanoarchaeia archaeon]